MGQNTSKRRSYTPGVDKNDEVPSMVKLNGDVIGNGSIEVHSQSNVPETSTSENGEPVVAGSVPQPVEESISPLNVTSTSSAPVVVVDASCSDVVASGSDVVACSPSTSAPTEEVPASPTSPTSAESTPPTVSEPAALGMKKSKRRKFPSFAFPLKRTASGRWTRKRRVQSSSGQGRPHSTTERVNLSRDESTGRPQSIFLDEIDLQEEDAKIDTVDLSDHDEEGKHKKEATATPIPPAKTKKKRNSKKNSSGRKKKSEKKTSKKDKKKSKKGSASSTETPNSPQKSDAAQAKDSDLSSQQADAAIQEVAASLVAESVTKAQAQLKEETQKDIVAQEDSEIKTEGPSETVESLENSAMELQVEEILSESAAKVNESMPQVENNNPEPVDAEKPKDSISTETTSIENDLTIKEENQEEKVEKEKNIVEKLEITGEKEVTTNDSTNIEGTESKTENVENFVQELNSTESLDEQKEVSDTQERQVPDNSGEDLKQIEEIAANTVKEVVEKALEVTKNDKPVEEAGKVNTDVSVKEEVIGATSKPEKDEKKEKGKKKEKKTLSDKKEKKSRKEKVSVKITKKLSSFFNKHKKTETGDTSKSGETSAPGNKTAGEDGEMKENIETAVCPTNEAVENTDEGFQQAPEKSLSVNVSVEPLSEDQEKTDASEEPGSPASNNEEVSSPESEKGLLKKISLGPRLRTAILRKKSSSASDGGKDEKRVSLTKPKIVENEITPPPRKLRPRKPTEQYSPITDGAHNSPFFDKERPGSEVNEEQSTSFTEEATTPKSTQGETSESQINTQATESAAALSENIENSVTNIESSNPTQVLEKHEDSVLENSSEEKVEPNNSTEEGCKDIVRNITQITVNTENESFSKESIDKVEQIREDCKDIDQLENDSSISEEKTLSLNIQTNNEMCENSFVESPTVVSTASIVLSPLSIESTDTKGFKDSPSDECHSNKEELKNRIDELEINDSGVEVSVISTPSQNSPSSSLPSPDSTNDESSEEVEKLDSKPSEPNGESSEPNGVNSEPNGETSEQNGNTEDNQLTESLEAFEKQTITEPEDSRHKELANGKIETAEIHEENGIELNSTLKDNDKTLVPDLTLNEDLKSNNTLTDQRETTETKG